MRLFLLLLVLINVVFAAWQLNKEPNSVAAEPELAADPIKNVKTIVLLSEVSEKQPRIIDQSRQQQENGKPGIPEVVDICITLGPFYKKADSEIAHALLNKSGANIKQRTVETQEATGYWVFLPPAASIQEAQKKYRELQGRQIDSFIMVKGQYRNAISLGFFSNRNTAQALKKQMESKGYKPEMNQRFRNKTFYWLDVQKGGGLDSAEVLFKEIKAKYPAVQQQPLNCG